MVRALVSYAKCAIGKKRMLLFGLIALVAAEYQLTLLNNYPMAVCLDGTPAGYYFEPSTTGSLNIQFYFEGGGWCYEANDCWGECWMYTCARAFSFKRALEHVPGFFDDVAAERGVVGRFDVTQLHEQSSVLRLESRLARLL
jgi:hypothetical protein